MPKILVQPDAMIASREVFFPPATVWDVATFEVFCQMNPDTVCELNAQGNLVLMSTSNAEADGLNARLIAQLVNWEDEHADYKAFGCSAGFLLSNGAVKSPDGALVLTADWEALSAEARASFPAVPLVFVLEVRSSANDSLKAAKEKMEEWISCGAQVGWLVDPVKSQLHVYRPGREPAVVVAPAEVEVGEEVAGLVLDLRKIWSD